MFLDFMGALQWHQSCCNIAGTFLQGAISAPCRLATHSPSYFLTPLLNAFAISLQQQKARVAQDEWCLSSMLGKGLRVHFF